MKISPLARRAATVLVVGAGVVFLALAIQSNWTQIAAYDWHVRWGRLALSIVLLNVSFVIATFIWKRVLDRFADGNARFAALVRIWFTSKIARYIPGKIWQFVAVGQLSAGSGASARVMVSSMIVNTGFILLSGVIIGSVTLARHIPGIPPRAVPAILAAGVVALLASHPRVINFGLLLLSRVTRRDTLTWKGGWGASVELMVLWIGNWLVQGTAFFLFAGSLVHLDASQLLPLAGINAFAFVAGYVAFVAPAGAGIREATMASLLRGTLPMGAAAVVAVASRLWTIASELIGVAVVLLVVPDPRTGKRGAASLEAPEKPDAPGSPPRT